MRAKEICQWSTAGYSSTAVLCHCHQFGNDERPGHCPVQLCWTHPASPSSRSWARAETAHLPGCWKARLLELRCKHSQWILYRSQPSFKMPNLAPACSSIPAHIWAGFSSHFLLLYSHHLPTSHSDMGTLSTCHTTNLGEKFYCNSVLIQHQK